MKDLRVSTGRGASWATVASPGICLNRIAQLMTVLIDRTQMGEVILNSANNMQAKSQRRPE